tara:strand:- start:275 stop:739 length:465 start_codon:yes stop_codon:yes gene_type:complete
MQSLFENWRRFITEAAVSYSGILKAMPSSKVVSEIQSLELPEGAVMLPPEKLHVTLVHQSILKPYRKEIKSMEFPEAPEPKLVRTADGAVELQEAVDDPKRSWVVFLENQEEMRAYVNQVMESLGAQADPEPERRYHISVANLTGSPTDSVRYP